MVLVWLVLGLTSGLHSRTCCLCHSQTDFIIWPGSRIIGFDPTTSAAVQDVLIVNDCDLLCVVVSLQCLFPHAALFVSQSGRSISQRRMNGSIYQTRTGGPNSAPIVPLSLIQFGIGTRECCLVAFSLCVISWLHRDRDLAPVTGVRFVVRSY